MKATTKHIYDTLKQPTILVDFEILKNKNPTYVYQETTLVETYDNFLRISDLVIRTIDANIFDSIPYPKRHQILTAISGIFEQVNQAKQYGFNISNSNVVPPVHAIIKGTNNLVDFVETANLFAKSMGLEDYKNEIMNLADVRRKYKTLLDQLDEGEKIQTNSEKIFSEINQRKKEIEKILGEANDKLKTLSELETNGNTVSTKTNQAHTNIKESEKEIESKKLQIETFASNIEEYKEIIEKLQNDAKNIIAKEKDINTLIDQAEKALSLKSAEGISAAFSSYYEAAKKSGNTTIFWWQVNLWILGAVAFIIAALVLTAWIVSGNGIADPTSISSIIGRVVAVAISIAGATFCANQFVKQRNIIEDYGYKSVLAKSIIAFTKEIKDRDENKVAEYLTQVLSEIHKDPLRSRSTKEEKNTGLTVNDLMEKMEKLGDIFAKFKK